VNKKLSSMEGNVLANKGVCNMTNPNFKSQKNVLLLQTLLQSKHSENLNPHTSETLNTFSKYFLFFPCPKAFSLESAFDNFISETNFEECKAIQNEQTASSSEGDAGEKARSVCINSKASEN
jgi:hypothetical protein